METPGTMMTYTKAFAQHLAAFLQLTGSFAKSSSSALIKHLLKIYVPLRSEFLLLVVLFKSANWFAQSAHLSANCSQNLSDDKTISFYVWKRRQEKKRPCA